MGRHIEFHGDIGYHKRPPYGICLQIQVFLPSAIRFLFRGGEPYAVGLHGAAVCRIGCKRDAADVGKRLLLLAP